MLDKEKKLSEENLKIALVATACRATVNKILDNYKQKYGKDSLSPEICECFGIEGMKHKAEGHMNISKEFFIRGSAFELTSKVSHYNSPEIINIGRCLALLVTQYPLNKDAHDVILKVTALAYVYLSHSIEMYKNTTQDAYMSRAALFKDHKDSEIVTEIIHKLGIILVEPFIISDSYFASQAENSRYLGLLSVAKDIHDELDCISVNGKDADEYTLKEISKIGEERHILLFKKLEQKYTNGDYNITTEDLYKIVDSYNIITEDMKNVSYLNKKNDDDFKFDKQITDILHFNQKINSAVKLKREENYKKALECYEEINEEYPNDSIVYRSWAKTLVSSGDYDLGLEYFIKSNQLIKSAKSNPDESLEIVHKSDDEIDNEKFIDILSNEPRDSKRFLKFLKSISGNQNYIVNNQTINDDIMTFRIKSQTALDNGKKLDKYFLIAANVYSKEWEIDFSKNLKYEEVIMAFAFCIKRITSDLNDSESNALIDIFFGLFPQTKKEKEQQFEIFKTPEIMLEDKNDFVLFVVDFTKRGCDIKSNCSRRVIIQIIYFLFQTMKKQPGKDDIINLLNMVEQFRPIKLINKSE